MDRQILRTEFSTQNGWGDAAVTALPSDASRRRYFRLTRGDETRLLMDMPPHEEEKFDEFILIGSHLYDIGMSAPEIYAFDAANGFALIEDFGEDTFTRLLNAGHDAAPLYVTAITAAAALQIKSADSALPLKHYDAEAMAGEINWFIEWYAPLYWSRKAGDAQQAEFTQVVCDIFTSLPQLPLTLLLRDFHVDNFMWLPERIGVQRCGILDFQDAKWGSPAYDLVSFLQDARRDIDPEFAQQLYDQYLVLRPEFSKADFAAHYAAMGMLRHARILGNFIRLWIRDDKPQYLQFMPRVTRQFLSSLQHPIAAPLREWCEKHLPDMQEKWPDKPAIELKKILLN